MKTNQIGAVQGDVPILTIDTLTPNGKLTQRRIVALGESTGHYHEIQGKCDVYEVERDIANQLFVGLEVVVVNEPVYLHHNSAGEHDTIEMIPGLYFIPTEIQQIEYDGEDERQVVD
jgi:hypothetical protein